MTRSRRRAFVRRVGVIGWLTIVATVFAWSASVVLTAATGQWPWKGWETALMIAGLALVIVLTYLDWRHVDRCPVHGRHREEKASDEEGEDTISFSPRWETD